MLPELRKTFWTHSIYHACGCACVCLCGGRGREEVEVLSTCRRILQWVEKAFEIQEPGARLGYNCREPGPGSCNVMHGCGLEKPERGCTEGKTERDVW